MGVVVSAGLLVVVYGWNQPVPLVALIVFVAVVDWHNVTTLHGHLRLRRTWHWVGVWLLLWPFASLLYFAHAWHLEPALRAAERHR